MDEDVRLVKKILNNVEKVIVGKSQAIEYIIIAMLCEGHVLIEDVPGVGKTSLASSISKTVNASFKRIQFTPDVLPSDITGFSIYNQKKEEFEYKPGAVMSNIVLADEINRTSPKTQASLLEVMEENQVTVDSVTYKVPKPFMVIATQNPVEYLGTYPLPEAQLDRFIMKINIGYPSAGDESHMLTRFKNENPLITLEPVVQIEDILRLQQRIKDIHVDLSLNKYIVELVSQTRKNRDILLGASPRGSLNLYRASQAWAFYSGRNYVIPDDIKKLVYPVLSHRILLKQEARLKKIQPEDILTDIINKTFVPVVD